MIYNLIKKFCASKRISERGTTETREQQNIALIKASSFTTRKSKRVRIG